MQIRDMQRGDLIQLNELYKQFWGETSSLLSMQVQFDEIAKKGTHILLVATEDEEVIGSVMGVICDELYGECMPFLVVENMIVNQNARRNGVGKLLLEELESRAKKRDCTQMILVTEADREDAVGFYEDNGFSGKTHKGYKKML